MKEQKGLEISVLLPTIFESVNVIHQDSDELSAMCNYFLRALISDSCILTPLSLLSNLWILLPLRSRFDTGDLSSPNEATSGRFP